MGFQNDGRIGLRSDHVPTKLFYRMFGDAISEYRAREIPIDGFGSSIAFEKSPWQTDSVKKVQRNLSLSHLTERKGVFCKYGARKYMQALHQRGQVRIAPAASFNDTNLGYARHDDELHTPYYISPYDFDLGLVMEPLLSALPVRQQYELWHCKPTNFYLYCVTVGFDYRYLIDFSKVGEPVDAVVVITDQNEFVRRLKKASKKIWPEFGHAFQMVNYFDPYWMTTRLEFPTPDVYFYKSIPYLYQSEHRLVVWPRTEKQILSDKWSAEIIEIGSLEDISEYYEIIA